MIANCPLFKVFIPKCTHILNIIISRVGLELYCINLSQFLGSLIIKKSWKILNNIPNWCDHYQTLIIKTLKILNPPNHPSYKLQTAWIVSTTLKVCDWKKNWVIWNCNAVIIVHDFRQHFHYIIVRIHYTNLF